jgi:hypothetical protein
MRLINSFVLKTQEGIEATADVTPLSVLTDRYSE